MSLLLTIKLIFVFFQKNLSDEDDEAESEAESESEDGNGTIDCYLMSADT